MYVRTYAHLWWAKGVVDAIQKTPISPLLAATRSALVSWRRRVVGSHAGLMESEGSERHTARNNSHSSEILMPFNPRLLSVAILSAQHTTIHVPRVHTFTAKNNNHTGARN